MDDETPQLILVTPVWNDASRLARFGPVLAGALAKEQLPLRWIIADDGSTEEEKRRLQELLATFAETYPTVRLMTNSQRTRKGGAIRKAWDAFPEADWLAFVDADGAVGAEDILRLMRKASSSSTGTSVVAIRRNASETPVTRPLFRTISFKLFVALTRWLLGVRYKDTQCGAKVIAGPAYRSVRPFLEETGFAFDAELLLALQVNGFRVDEAAVAWTEQESGKVHPLRDAWGMIGALLRIRKRHRTGTYAKEKARA